MSAINKIKRSSKKVAIPVPSDGDHDESAPTPAPAKSDAKNIGVQPSGIVGVGASAGGFEAIKQFLQNMPSDSGLAFVIVQHLASTHISLAAELLASCTSMSVLVASEGARIEANHVYTAPSDKDVAVEKGCFLLTERNRSPHHIHLPIDHLFHSLGAAYGSRAIGVILSGNGNDGTLGSKTIALHEGIVLVQEPSTAAFDGMPRSAIAANVANFILPVDKMPQVISDCARHPYLINSTVPIKDDNPKTTQELIAIVQARRGYDFTGYKRSTFLRRVQRRMSLHGITGLSTYAALLKKETAEVDQLFKDLLIGVTEFFRDDDAWKTLADEVMKPIVAAKQKDEAIRIWIPGCSTGEEAYTMAIVALDRVRAARKTCPVQIFATDTNSDALEIGRAGRYPVSIAKRMTAAQVKRYFVPTPDKEHFIVSDEVRACVVFGVQNLFADPPFGRVDLISCRNVLIYLETELQKKVLNIFHFALRREGYLFLGSAESNCGRDGLFKPLSKRWRLFQRVGMTDISMLRLPASISDSRMASNLHYQQVPQQNVMTVLAQKMLLDRFVPASVLVNSKYEALHFSGATDEFLMRPRGAPTQDLMFLVREGLRSRLRAMLREAATTSLTVNGHGVQMKKGDHFEVVHITVVPHNGGEMGQLFLVVFRPDTQPVKVFAKRAHQGILVQQLEEELQATRDDLLESIERFEATNDDLKNSNEQILMSNEELRSLNEELESSKEEMQSLNEELSTVNQQLETKLRELEVLHNDVNNLLESSDIATICLDPALRIKWFAPATKKLFHFIASDIGRNISDLLAALNDKGLITAVHAVLANELVPDCEFQLENGRWLIRRILPYKIASTDTASNLGSTGSTVRNGVIVTYTDITDIHFAIEVATASKKDLHESQERTDKLKTLSAALALAEERERKSLAKFLHDDFGQMLAVLALKAVTLKKQTMANPMKVMVDDLSTTIERLNKKMRDIAFQLNPPMLDQLGVVTALKWVAEEVQRVFNLKITLHDDGSPKPLAPSVSATVVRAVRELLVNVAKHANIEAASITLSKIEDKQLLITVSDAGAGFNPEEHESSAELGLISMKERVGLMGGEIDIHSVRGDGTTVTIKVPMIHIEHSVLLQQGKS